jgi:hypothetical protein
VVAGILYFYRLFLYEEASATMETTRARKVVKVPEAI